MMGDDGVEYCMAIERRSQMIVGDIYFSEQSNLWNQVCTASKFVKIKNRMP